MIATLLVVEESPLLTISKISCILVMAIGVVEFSREGYKIRKDFA